jgi:hypothetical protein
MSNTIRDVLLGRWKPQFDDVPRLKPVRAALNAALKEHDDVRERVGKIGQNKNLSPLGRLDEVRASILKATAPIIHRSRAVAKSTRDDLATWRTRLLPPKPDPKDAAGAAMRAEMRSYVRGLSLSARTAYFVQNDPDGALIQAVLEAPSFLSGISEELRTRMVDAYVNRTHPKDLAQIAQAEEAIELLDAATGVTFNAAKTASEFPSDQMFSDFVDKAAPPATKPPLASPPTTPTSTSDELYERLLAEGRAEIAALTADAT